MNGLVPATSSPERHTPSQEALSDGLDGQTDAAGNAAQAVPILDVGGCDLVIGPLGPVFALGDGLHGGVEMVHGEHAIDSNRLDMRNSNNLDLSTQMYLNRGMRGQHPNKTKHQLRRAHKLMDVIDALTPGETNEFRATFAETLSVARWADIATLAGITAPSITTVTMAIGLLEQRIIDEELADEDPFACFAKADR